MSESDYQEILKRLGKLEKQNRFMKTTACVVILFIASVLLTGATQNTSDDVVQEIRAERIVLLDDDGNERIVMDTKQLSLQPPKKEAFLYMYDPNGRETFCVSASPSLDMYDRQIRAHLLMWPNNFSMSLSPEADFLITLNPNGSALSLGGYNNQEGIHLGTYGPSPHLFIYDSDEKNFRHITISKEEVQYSEAQKTKSIINVDSGKDSQPPQKPE